MRALDLPAGPWIVGHRGAAGEVLENTLESVSRALVAGVAMIEVDLQLTRDGHLVVFHDWSLERLAGDPRTVERSSWRGLSRVALTGPDRAGTHRIPRLRDLLAAVPDDFPINLEAKIRHVPAAAFARRLLAEIGRRPQILVSSFDWKLLAAIRRRAPDLPLAPISGDDRPGLESAGAELGAWSLNCHHTLATRKLIDSPCRAGRPILAYTVNLAQRARTLLRRGVAGIFTDQPAEIRSALTRWPP